MADRFSIQSLRWALTDAYAAGFTIGFDPAMIVLGVEGQVLDAGEHCC
jgi:hypothetical protein